MFWAILNGRPLEAESNKSCRRDSMEHPKHFRRSRPPSKIGFSALSGSSWGRLTKNSSQWNKGLERMETTGDGMPFWREAGLRLFLGHWGGPCELWPLARGFLLRASCVHVLVLSVWVHLSPSTHRPRLSCRPPLVAAATANTQLHGYTLASFEARSLQHNKTKKSASYGLFRSYGGGYTCETLHWTGLGSFPSAAENCQRANELQLGVHFLAFLYIFYVPILMANIYLPVM